jgi:hypothetical protein
MHNNYLCLYSVNIKLIYKLFLILLDKKGNKVIFGNIFFLTIHIYTLCIWLKCVDSMRDLRKIQINRLPILLVDTNFYFIELQSI